MSLAFQSFQSSIGFSSLFHGLVALWPRCFAGLATTYSTTDLGITGGDDEQPPYLCVAKAGLADSQAHTYYSAVSASVNKFQLVSAKFQLVSVEVQLVSV